VSKTAAQRLYDRAADIVMEAMDGAPKRLLRGDAIDIFTELAAVPCSPRSRALADQLQSQAVDILHEHGGRLTPRIVARFANECADKGASRPRYVSRIPLPELWTSIVNELASARTSPLRANG
jgi:hypothetical protein